MTTPPRRDQKPTQGLSHARLHGAVARDEVDARCQVGKPLGRGVSIQPAPGQRFIRTL